MTKDFNQWWDESPVKANNPYTENTPAYWAWEGWCAGVEAERNRCVARADIALLGADITLRDRVLKAINIRVQA